MTTQENNFRTIKSTCLIQDNALIDTLEDSPATAAQFDALCEWEAQSSLNPLEIGRAFHESLSLSLIPA